MVKTKNKHQAKRWLFVMVGLLITGSSIASCSQQLISATPTQIIIPTPTLTTTPTSLPPPTNTPVPTVTPTPIFNFGPDYDMINTDFGDPDSWPVIGFDEWNKWIPFIRTQIRPEDIPKEPLIGCNYVAVEMKQIGGEAELYLMMFDHGHCNQQIPVAATKVGLWKQPDGSYLQYHARITYMIRSVTELSNGKDYILVSFDVYLEPYTDKLGGQWLYEKMFPCIKLRCADLLPYFKFTIYDKFATSSAYNVANYYKMQHPDDAWKQHAKNDAQVIEAWLADTLNPPEKMDGMTFPALPAIYK